MSQRDTKRARAGHDEAPEGPEVVLRVRVPAEVAEWLALVAGRQYKARSVYHRDFLVALYLRNKGGTNATDETRNRR